MGYWEEEHAGKMSFSSHHVQGAYINMSDDCRCGPWSPGPGGVGHISPPSGIPYYTLFFLGGGWWCAARLVDLSSQTRD